MMIQGTRNILVALNAIAFIAYMIILMRNQMKENARIGLLNLQLQTANIRLKEMNEQLKDYSEMTEKKWRRQGNEIELPERFMTHWGIR